MTHAADSKYSWFRLVVSLALATIGGIGLWAVVVVLPTIQTEFGIDRSGASFPYTMTMIGFAIGGVMMGKVADKFGIWVPLVFGTLCLGFGFIGAAYATLIGATLILVMRFGFFVSIGKGQS